MTRVAPTTPISRGEVIERAESWLRPSVPHSSTRFHQNEYGIYRTDCSGYVSMAWGLPGVPPDLRGGLDAAGLTSVSTRIDRDELLAGDALIRVGDDGHPGHAIVFHEWAGGGRVAYWGFEQSAEVGTTHRVVPYPHGDGAAGGLYLPRRYAGITVPA
ncbi:putative membrane protein [Actinokineospora spheciospongiae]|uniref:Putative membrane protein n=1 Tax=Actinokineospora spheciospongiae TaxID=909613 RepID=W7IMZ9_9PSEU|nr:hypothetical protein [Actinokineospora spheciospongiae]EWC61768.1 putative membrane protein [Actinokineospora spheciospongiae]PWW62111.1 hypothetical protein DFQ13_106364 [Actinokineospora spheciospongiae]